MGNREIEDRWGALAEEGWTALAEALATSTGMDLSDLEDLLRTITPAATADPTAWLRGLGRMQEATAHRLAVISAAHAAALVAAIQEPVIPVALSDIQWGGRDFDGGPISIPDITEAQMRKAIAELPAGWVDKGQERARARAWIDQYGELLPDDEWERVLRNTPYPDAAHFKTPTGQWFATLPVIWEHHHVLPGRGMQLIRPMTDMPTWVLDAYCLCQRSDDQQGTTAPSKHKIGERGDGVQRPSPAPLFLNGVGLIPSCFPFQGVMAALHHAPTWQTMEDGRPYFSHTPQASRKKGRRQGQVTTFLHPPQAPAPTDAYTPLPDQALKVLDDKLRALGERADRVGDVLFAWFAKQLERAEPDGAVWISAEEILNSLGAPKMKKREGKAVRTAGHRTEDIAEIASCVDLLNHMWLDVEEVIVHEQIQGKRPRRKTATLLQAKLLILDKQVAQRSLSDPDSPHDWRNEIVQHYLGGSDLPIAWHGKSGPWLEPFTGPPNQQMALLFKRVLEYDPYHEKWEKRLGRYFTLHLRADSKHGRDLGRYIGPLLDTLDLPIDRQNPQRTRNRMEKALARLVADGVIGGWTYALEKRLPAKGWIDEWLEKWEVQITPPPIVAEHYARFTTRGRPRQQAKTGARRRG